MLIKLLPIYLVIFISFFCYSSMLTIFVPLFQDSLSPLFNPAISSGARNILAGVFLSLYPLGQFIGSPIIGAVSDRMGRKRILVASLLVSLFSLSMIAFSIRWHSVPLLGAFCFIAGLGESNMTIALSSIAGMTDGAERVNYFSYAWVLCSLGYILGSMYGGAASVIGYFIPFVLEALCFLLVLAMTIVWFQEPKPTPADAPARRSLWRELLAFRNVFRPSPIRNIYLSNFLFYIAFFGVLRVELIYMQDHMKLAPARIAFYYSYASVVAMIANFVVAPRMCRWLSLKAVLLTSVVGSALSAVVFILPQGEHWLYLTTGLVGLFVPIVLATSCSYLSENAKAEQQGMILGNNQSLQVLSEAISAAAGGVIFAYSSRMPFLVFAVIGGLGLIFALKFTAPGTACALRWEE